MHEWITTVPDKIFLWNYAGIYIGYFYPLAGIKHLVGPPGFLGKHIDEVLPADAAKTVRESLKLAIEAKQAQVGKTHLVLDGIPYTQTIRFIPYEDKVMGVVHESPT